MIFETLLITFAISSKAETVAQKPASQDDGKLHLTIRQQTPKTTGRHGWLIIEKEATWHPSETAVIIVDMWDKHWSWGATDRM